MARKLCLPVGPEFGVDQGPLSYEREELVSASFRRGWRGVDCILMDKPPQGAVIDPEGFPRRPYNYIEVQVEVRPVPGHKNPQLLLPYSVQ